MSRSESAPLAFQRAIGRQAARPGNGCARLFSAGGRAAFASRSKIAGLRHPPLTLRPCAALRVLCRAVRRLVIATKAAMGAADPAKGLP